MNLARARRTNRRLHKAGKVGDARRILCAHMTDNDTDLLNAVIHLNSWLKKQPEDVRRFALMSPRDHRIAREQESATKRER